MALAHIVQQRGHHGVAIPSQVDDGARCLVAVALVGPALLEEECGQGGLQPGSDIGLLLGRETPGE